MEQQQISLAVGDLHLDLKLKTNKLIVKNCTLLAEDDAKMIRLIFETQRLSGPFWMSLFIPSICLILAAEITLFIDHSHFEAMIMVALTSNLVMYSLYNTIQEKLPEDSSYKLIDYWLLHGLIMPMVVFIVLAMNELLNNRSTNKKHGRKITVVPVDQGNHQSLQNRGQPFDYGFGERKVLLCMLVCKLIVPITSLVFFLIFFIVISVN